MQNKILAQIDCGNEASHGRYYLDTAAELSKLQRLNHHQVDAKGKAIVYDILITATPQLSSKMIVTGDPPADSLSLEQDRLNIQTETVPLTWSTRNAVKMAHKSREDLRKASGVSKKSIGKYAKTIRCNMDNIMQGIPYAPSLSTGATTERIYAMSDVITPNLYDGGVWDYTQLTQVEYDAVTGIPAADAFDLIVCGSHSNAAPGPYTFVSVLQAYGQRRQTVFDAATATAGGDTQFIVDDSPFFRIVDTDTAEDEYTAITLDEQDNPPYDRNPGGLRDSQIPSPVDIARFSNQNGLTSLSWRVQAPLGLLRLVVDNMLPNTIVDFEFEVMATYPME